MIRGLLIYVATMTTALVGTALITGVPLATSAGVVLLCEITVVGTLIGAAVLRWMSRPRPSRQEWTHRPAPRLPEPLPTYRVETPAPLQIEAPGRELIP